MDSSSNARSAYIVSVVCLCGIVGLSACSNQLPSRTDGITIDAVPNLDPSIIPSNNGLLSIGITAVPGSYCIAGSNDQCDPAKLSPAQCLNGGASVEVAPKTNPTPSYDSLIDNKYTATGSVPFVRATASAEYLDEVRAVIAGTAQIAPNSPNNGFPGVEGLKTCILKNTGPGAYGTVFWISSANIIDVTLRHFKQVSSTEGVTAVAFGLNGTTYNHSGVTEEKIWIGLEAHPISIGTIPPAQKLAAERILTSNPALPSAFLVRQRVPPEPLPPLTKSSFLRQ